MELLSEIQRIKNVMGVIKENENESSLQMNRNLGKFVETLNFLKLFNKKIERMLMDILSYKYKPINRIYIKDNVK